MIIREKISDTLIKTYSDKGMLIRGGFPFGLYSEAIDPIEANRLYEETDIPIEPIEEEEFKPEVEIEEGIEEG